jgi:pSer/pThr/pTyr-binding forkhead associated (FHA) protein
MSIHLTTLYGPSLDLRISAYELPLTIGRNDAADIFLPDQWVSRWHCKLVAENDQLKVIDLGSRHGTYVNGERVDEAWLDAGDELNLGLTTVRVSGSLTSDAPSSGSFHFNGV